MPVTVDLVAPESVTLAGPALGGVGFPYTIRATTGPIPLSQPLTYTWWASEQLARTVTGGPQAAVIFTWETTGRKEIGVTVENAAGAVSAHTEIEITVIQPLYLPVVGRE
jgi:hypothetical protein